MTDVATSDVCGGKEKAMSVTVGEGLVTRACTSPVEKTLEKLEGMLGARGSRSSRSWITAAKRRRSA